HRRARQAAPRAALPLSLSPTNRPAAPRAALRRPRPLHHEGPWRDGTLSLVFAPEDLVARLCAMVPPPRWHFICFLGVPSAHASLRPGEERASVLKLLAPIDFKQNHAACTA